MDELYARGDAELELGESAEVVESLGFEAETTRFGLCRDG